jgi:hypothetical protein
MKQKNQLKFLLVIPSASGNVNSYPRHFKQALAQVLNHQRTCILKYVLHGHLERAEVEIGYCLGIGHGL